MTGPLVTLKKHDSYDAAPLKAAVRDLLTPHGGMAAFVKPGDTVLLKPNLVFGRDASKAINTHPGVVRVVAELAWEAGAARIQVGDSPGYGSAAAAARNCGILAMVEEMGLEMVEFTSAERHAAGRLFPVLELAKEVFEADVVINLPKLKTHGQMLMTLAVKNMFGAVVGARKLRWHYRAGRDRQLFARMINEVAQAARPHLSILDGVVGMDELGPSSGRVRQVGLLAAGPDPWAVDAAIMDVLGIEREALFILAAATEHGPHEWRGLRLEGDGPASLRPDDWRIPEMVTLQMHGGFVDTHFPRIAARLRDSIAPLPQANAACTGCGYCAGICPAQAMRMDAGRVRIDAAKCIRCYCCHELCQYQGLDMRRGLLARLLQIV